MGGALCDEEEVKEKIQDALNVYDALAMPRLLDQLKPIQDNILPVSSPSNPDPILTWYWKSKKV